jgi:hypothetical protein
VGWGLIILGRSVDALRGKTLSVVNFTPNAQTKGSVKPVGLFHTLVLLKNYISTIKGILIKDSIHHPAGVAVAAVALTAVHKL